MADEIVKVKRSDLEAIMKANTEAYNTLDNISTYATELEEGIRSAISKLEDAPSDIDEIIVEEDEEDK